ncbi:Mobile element protein [Clostridiaceae bacterium JG1575]|nr:Mobile element protein [Clostridiaceae bacterium JG1575]
MKAHANKKKNHKEQIQKVASWYVDELEKEIGLDRQLHGKKELPKTEKTQSASITVSDVDPKSGLFHKGEHKEVFAYNVQTACDKKAYGLEYKVHPGNDHDSKTFPALYDTIRKLKPEMMVFDADYKTPAIARRLLEEEVKPIFPYTRPKGKKELFFKKEFIYDECFDCYLCPNDQPIKYSTTNREGYREYKSDPNVCKDCPPRDQCTKSKNMIKVVTRHVGQDYLEEAEELRHVRGVKDIYAKRKEPIERVFNLSKEVFGFRYTMLIGKRSMEITAALTYAPII